MRDESICGFLAKGNRAGDLLETSRFDSDPISDVV